MKNDNKENEQIVSNSIQINNQENIENKEDNQDSTEKQNKIIKVSKVQSIIFHIVAIICIILFAMAFSPKTLQNDTFYTITIGEYIYNNGISNLTEDVYSIHDLKYTYPHYTQFPHSSYPQKSAFGLKGFLL